MDIPNINIEKPYLQPHHQAGQKRPLHPLTGEDKQLICHSLLITRFLCVCMKTTLLDNAGHLSANRD